MTRGDHREGYGLQARDPVGGDVVVKMCEYKAFKMGDLIYNLGRTSDEMLLLLQGNLVAISG